MSPVCVALVGAYGIKATRSTAKEGREHVEKLDRERFRHQQQMAQDARRADAYVRLLGMVERAGQ